MKKNKSKVMILFLSAMIVATLLLVGCGKKQGNGESRPVSTSSVAIKDDSGVEVTIKGVPGRIVSLTPSNTEILFALGLGDRVVGVTTYCDYPPEAKKKPKIGDLQANVEKIVSLKPDLVVAKWTMNKDAVASLRKLNVPVLCVEPESIEGVYRAIRLIAKATGTSEAGEKIVAGMKARLEQVKQKVSAIPPSKRLRVFIEVGDDPLYTAGSRTFIDELVNLAGGVNIAADIKGYQMYSIESVVEKNPDVILAPDSYYIDVEKIIQKRPGWSSIKAVQNGRIINKLDPNLINRPGPRSAQAVEAIARALYPELFK
ncbi:MAG TPA: cobalamin-binding protein [Syntrophomonadaceae bacterium]|nr:cobalamin-binding protein [Syntrophomonadaceae bacterium]